MMLYQQSVRCSLAKLGSQSNELGTNKDHRSQVHLLHPQQRGLFSFISQLVTRQTNYCDGLVGFHGGSKSLSVPKTAAQETYRGRRISPSYQLRSIFGVAEGLFKLLLSYLLKISELITVTNCGTTEIDLLDLDDLDGPPNTPPPAAGTRP